MLVSVPAVRSTDGKRNEYERSLGNSPLVYNRKENEILGVSSIKLRFCL